MGKQKTEVRGQKSENGGKPAVCTIDVTFNLTEVTGKMFIRETKASGTIEDVRFSLDAELASGNQIITIGERVWLLTNEEVIRNLYTATRHSPPATANGVRS